jgi:hypothetical protein
MRTLTALAVLVITLSFAATARADDAPKPNTQWYGWQTLMTDGAAFVVLVSALPAGDQLGSRVQTDVLLTAGGIYLMGAPVVHLAHGRPGVAAASLGVRAGVPTVLVGGAYFGTVAAVRAIAKSDSGGGWGPSAPAALGMLAVVTVGGLVAASGIVLPIVLDAAVLGREPVTPSSASQLRVVPQLDGTGRPAGLALTGTAF